MKSLRTIIITLLLTSQLGLFLPSVFGGEPRHLSVYDAVAQSIGVDYSLKMQRFNYCKAQKKLIGECILDITGFNQKESMEIGFAIDMPDHNQALREGGNFKGTAFREDGSILCDVSIIIKPGLKSNNQTPDERKGSVKIIATMPSGIIIPCNETAYLLYPERILQSIGNLGKA